MAEYITNGQSNYGWSLTWDAAGRYPIIAKRRFATLVDAQAFVDDISATATATEGLIISVIADTTAKNNGVYYVASVAMAEGEKGSLVKVGGTETETADDYAAAVELSKTLVVGQLIKVSNEYTENEGEENEVTYQKGFYIVEAAGVISALATSTGSDDEVGALKTRVDGIEAEIGVEATEGVEATGLYKEIAAAEAAAKAYADGLASNYDAAGAAEDAQAAAEATAKAYTDGREVEIDKKWAAADVQALADAKKYTDDEIAELDLANTYDAKGAAADALKDAKAYADTLNIAMDIRVDALETIDHEAYKTADATLKSELQTEIANKVDAVEGSRLMTNAEGTKLAGIAEGAQVNVIEKVKVNGTALSIADADKSVDITIPSAPVQGVAAGENIISLDGDKLKSTLTIAYVAATETENAVLRLQGIDGEVISSIDATAFVKDGMVESAKLDGPQEGETGTKYLVLTFNTAAGKENIRLDVSDLFNPYTASNGVVLENGNFSLKLATGEQYLTVGTDGLAVAEALWTKVDEKDNAVLASAKTYAENEADAAEVAAKSYTDTEVKKVQDAVDAINDTESGILAQAKADATTKANAAQVAAEATAAADATSKADAALEEAKTYVDGKVDGKFDAKGSAADALTDAKTYADSLVKDGEGTSLFDAAGSAAQALTDAKDYADRNFVKLEGFNEFAEDMETKLTAIEEGAQVNVVETVKVNNIKATITDKVAEVKVEADDIELGTVITADGEEVYGSTQKLSSVLQGIQDSISVAVSGGLTGVVAGNGIEVSAVSANKQTVSAKVSTAEGNLISVDENGLYAAMYYEGDDAE